MLASLIYSAARTSSERKAFGASRCWRSGMLLDRSSPLVVELRRYAVSARYVLLPLIGLALLPLIVVLPVRVLYFPDSSPNSWSLLTILAPATEEPVKLALILAFSSFANIVGILLRHRSHRAAGSRIVPPAVFLLLLPVVTGLFFGLWEHSTTYPAEPPIALVTRVVAHIGYTCTAFTTCLFIWRMGRRAATGLWLGILAGMVPHGLFNLGAVAPPEWPTHAFTYALTVGLASFVVALLLLNRELQHEPGSPPARVLVGEENAHPAGVHHTDLE